MPYSYLKTLLATLALFSLAGCAFFSERPATTPTVSATNVPLPTPATFTQTATAGAEQEPTQPAPQTLTPTPDASLPIRLAWFYKPPDSGLDTLPQDYDFFILTHNDESARDQLESLGVTQPILQYLLFSEIMDPGSCNAAPNNDQVAFQPGDYCWIQSNYPDWFLTGKSGQTLGQGQYRVMDSGNSDWQTFWLNRASLLQDTYHWDGIFLDNVEASLSKLADWGSLPAAYPTDASYQAAIENALKQLYTTYFQPYGRPVYANIIAIKDPQVWLDYLQYLDGAMLENFATGWPDDNGLSPADWERQMEMVAQAQAMGKTVILVAQGDQYDQQREEFALGSYLLVSDGLAYFRYTNHNNYEQNWIYANQKLDLGAPLGARYAVGQAWQRDFTHGSVIVDPAARTASINLH